MNELRLVNRLESIKDLHSFIADYCSKQNISLGTQNKIILSIEELFVNTISYGYTDTKKHTIIVRFEINNKSLAITILDDAKPFNPILFPHPNISLPIDKRKVGNLGIFLVKNLMDDISYTRNREQNIVTLKLQLQGE